MKVLGIYDSHNCGACLVQDGRIIAAIEEERLTRNKIEFGFPYNSIRCVMEITNTSWKEIDAVAIAGLKDPPPWYRLNPKMFKFKRKMGFYWSLQYTLWRIIYTVRKIFPFPQLETYLNRLVLTTKIKRIYPDIDLKKVFLVDHHLAHASAGYRTSGFNKALVFGLDGSGDGYSSTVFTAENGELNFIAGSSEKASLGKLYSNVTLGLGFKKISGEGKVMGLSAFGDSESFFSEIDRVIQIKDIEMGFFSTEDLLGNTYAKKIHRIYSRKFSREDIAAATQRKLEEMVVKIVEHFVKKLDIANVIIAGGVASNVNMNQVIRELGCVNSTFVFPNMGDGGLSAGAALEICYSLGKEKGKKFFPYRLDNVFLGPAFSNEKIKKTIETYNLKAEYVEDMESRIAELVAEGKIVARVNGRMEFGPRALGNRSILVLPTSPHIEDVLNQRLRRDEFMPFAPSIIEEYAMNEYLEDGVPSPFMTETFYVKEGIKEKYPAVVHVDNTCRPQTVNEENETYYRIIKRVGELTGHYVVLNTSYNMHEEPIVCSPEDAIDTFLKKAVDYLALGNYLLSSTREMSAAKKKM